MQTKKYNIVNPKPYGEADQNGRQKTFWANVGTMTEFHKEDGTVNRIIEMNDNNVQYQVFAVEPRENQGQANQGSTGNSRPAQNNSSTSAPIDYPESDINPEDIPF